MEKCHWVAVGYSILEHQLGKSQFGSVIGLVGRLTKSILAFVYSRIRLFIVKGK